MRRPFFAALAACALMAPAHASNYLPFNHTGHGQMACRSFISVPGKGDTPYWSDIFATNESGYDVMPKFEAFVRQSYGAIGRIHAPTCFKFASTADAERMIQTHPPGVSTRWRQ
ncbi:hypothetical protein HUS23_07030 [Ectothiorhodospiraceae bacterium 2226]|nr:hypothetical protein HUS23_07030 [Ectothiorhodospiraceae bacterium 2226]